MLWRLLKSSRSRDSLDSRCYCPGLCYGWLTLPHRCEQSPFQGKSVHSAAIFAKPPGSSNKTKGESHFSVLPLPLPLPLRLTPSPCPSKRVVSARGVKHTPMKWGHHLVTVTSSYIVASWLLRHQSRQVLITNFQGCVCKCVYVRLRGFY